MSYSKHPSIVTAATAIAKPCLGQVWRDDHGDVHATVRLGHADLLFRNPADARAIAEACAAAARDLEALEAQPSLRTLPDFT